MLGRTITALGITQIVGWGTTYYSSAVLFTGMAADTGWSITLAYGAFSWAMLVSGLVSRRMGVLVERHGERRVMTLGSIGITIGLLAVAAAQHPAHLVAAWTLLGLAMRASLYETAFSALARLAGSGARRAISMVTLYGGLASSVFWPLGHWMAAHWGWRGSFAAYAILNLLVCVPLHRLCLQAPPGAAPAAGKAPATAGTAPPASAVTGPAPTPEPAILEGPARDRALMVLSGLLAAHSFVFGALSAHMLTLLQSLGLAAAAAVTLASVKGVAQVGARFAELSLQRHLGPIAVGMISTGLLPLGLLVMDFGAPQVMVVTAGCLIYGASNGLITIVRGTVSLQMFGHAGYAATLGRIAAPGLIAGALAPMAYAALIERFGNAVGLEVLTGVSLLGFAGMCWLARLQKRSLRNTDTSAR
ncbi:MAG: MFS transporter [Betaproteobacteria bacterium]|nr:MFS transporter [Betaproteobacteria bacterium]